MFSRSRYVLVLRKHTIETGRATRARVPEFSPGETYEYAPESLAEVFRQIAAKVHDNICVSIGEELVYVTELTFPAGTNITRSLVQSKTEENIPEDLRTTEWDFSTLRFSESRKSEQSLCVQVAVMEGAFFRNLKQSLGIQPLTFECVLPESYVLANFEAALEGVSVIVRRNQEVSVLVAAEQGLVLTTLVVEGTVTSERLTAFLGLVTERKAKRVARVIFSGLDETAVGELIGGVAEDCESLIRDYNLLLGTVLFAPRRGRDESILNLNLFQSAAQIPWWRRLLKRKPQAEKSLS